MTRSISLVAFVAVGMLSAVTNADGNPFAAPGLLFFPMAKLVKSAQEINLSESVQHCPATVKSSL
jgi:hypothetical protein